jgi:hypothetical protein
MEEYPLLPVMEEYPLPILRESYYTNTVAQHNASASVHSTMAP